MASNNTSPESQPPKSEDSSQALQDSQHIRPQHPFYLLPAELILDIIDLLPPEAFINFAFANYPFLHASGLAPALSRVRINYIQDKTRIPALFPLFRIPAEITLEIMHHLKPIDLMRFVLANYQDLARQGITPPLTEDTLRQLRIALGSGLDSSRWQSTKDECLRTYPTYAKLERSYFFAQPKVHRTILVSRRLPKNK
jgi:hypothetical protein